VPCYVHNYRLHPGWYTRELKGNIRSKERCYKNYKRFRAESDHKEYVRLRRFVQTQILRDSYIHLVENSVQKDPKGFWLYVHDRKDHTRIPAKMSHDDVTYNQPQDIINSFADYSISIYSTSSLPGKCTAGTYSNCLRPCITLNKFDTSECDNVPDIFWSGIAEMYSSNRWYIFLTCPWYRARFRTFGKLQRLCQFVKAETWLRLRITAQWLCCPAFQKFFKLPFSTPCLRSGEAF
jgi:hypothetical protein